MPNEFDLNQFATPRESATFPRMESLAPGTRNVSERQVFALIAVAAGLAATVGLWLFSVLIVGGFHLL